MELDREGDDSFPDESLSNCNRNNNKKPREQE
jgi:hypothetical protein